MFKVGVVRGGATVAAGNAELANGGGGERRGVAVSSL